MKFVLIDFQHLAYKCIAMPQMTALVTRNGVTREEDTTIPTGTIKSVVTYGGKGAYYTGVFLEGGSDRRKAINSEYKANRKGQAKTFYEGINLAVELMYGGGVSLYRKKGFEADDLICSMVYKLKNEYPDAEIEVITGDHDLLSLVDEQVSVWMRGTRQFALDKSAERRMYYQVTPHTWDAYMEGTSAFKGYGIPYGGIMLYKMIKGDKADNIEMAVKGYGKVAFSKLILKMRDDGVRFEEIFRNHNDFDTVIRPVLANYFDDTAIEALKENHKLIKMETDIPVTRPNQINFGRLAQEVSKVDMHLKP